MLVELGTLTALSLVLGAAGAAKLLGRSAVAPPGPAWLSRPVPRRLLGGGEVAVALAALATGGAAGGVLLACAFAAFTVVHLRRWRGGEREDCGCFGQDGAPSGPRQIVLVAGAAAASGAAALSTPPSLGHLAGRHPASALALVLVAAAAAWLWQRAFTMVATAPAPLSERLVTSSASFLERRIPRRAMLLRLATAGSALTVAPLRYLLYPGTAMAAISPSNCSGGLCTDGYTAFCCEINQGSNTCPSGTFAGGWWMCTDYAGRQLCHDAGVRYYVDCNRLPGQAYPGGCHCAHDSCNYRRVACNVFRYGQCNTQISGVTEVVCRMVVCENPGNIPSLNCSSSVAVDDAVCGQDVPCLEPRARQLAGAGGV